MGGAQCQVVFKMLQMRPYFSTVHQNRWAQLSQSSVVICFFCCSKISHVWPAGANLIAGGHRLSGWLFLMSWGLGLLRSILWAVLDCWVRAELQHGSLGCVALGSLVHFLFCPAGGLSLRTWRLEIIRSLRPVDPHQIWWWLTEDLIAALHSVGLLIFWDI